MEKIKLIFSLSIIFIALSSCRKYDDNPALGYVFTKRYLDKNIFYLKELFVNEIDSTQKIKDELGEKCLFSFDFNIDDENGNKADMFFVNGKFSTFNHFGFYKTYIYMESFQRNESYKSYLEYFSGGVKWNMKKMYKNDLWFEISKNGKTYFLKLEKKQ